MNYFSNFLGLFFMGFYWIYLSMILVVGVVKLKELFKSIRQWKR